MGIPILYYFPIIVFFILTFSIYQNIDFLFGFMFDLTYRFELFSNFFHVYLIIQQVLNRLILTNHCNQYLV